MIILSPSFERNREYIFKTIAELLPPSGTVLEISSGSGQHSAYADYNSLMDLTEEMLRGTRTFCTSCLMCPEQSKCV